MWGALGDRTIPVPTYGIEAEGRWAAIGVRGRAVARKVAFGAVYRTSGGLGGGGHQSGNEVWPPVRVSVGSGDSWSVLCRFRELALTAPEGWV